MPSREEVGLAKRVSDIERAQASNDLIHVRTRIDVYERAADDNPKRPKKVDERPDLDLLIHPATGERRLRHIVEDKDWFDKLAKKARLLNSPIKAHAKQVGPLLDDTNKAVWILGGSRAGKTDILAAKAKRTMILRGGPEALFWWLSPTWEKAGLGSKKLFRQQPTRPAMFPRELVRSYPTKPQTGRNTAYLYDGSNLDFHHGNGDGDNLRGDDVAGVFCDEFTAIDRIENYRISMNRTLDSGGQWCGSSTPKQGHWAYDAIIEADDDDDAAVYSFTCFDNPWISKKQIERLIKKMGGPDDPVCQREVFGRWISDGVLAFEDFDPQRHTRTGEGKHAESFGFKNITAQVAPPVWDNADADYTYVGGHDFNNDPMGACMAQVCVPPGEDEGNPDNWMLIVLDEMTTVGQIEKHLERLVKVYPRIPFSVDPAGAMSGSTHHSARFIRGATTDMTIMREYGFAASAAAYHKGDPTYVNNAISVALCNRMFRTGRILIHRRCKKLIHGLQVLLANRRGGRHTRPGTQSDKDASVPDAFRYLVHKLFSKHVLVQAPPSDGGGWLFD